MIQVWGVVPKRGDAIGITPPFIFCISMAFRPHTGSSGASQTCHCFVAMTGELEAAKATWPGLVVSMQIGKKGRLGDRQF